MKNRYRIILWNAIKQYILRVKSDMEFFERINKFFKTPSNKIEFYIPVAEGVISKNELCEGIAIEFDKKITLKAGNTYKIIKRHNGKWILARLVK